MGQARAVDKYNEAKHFLDRMKEELAAYQSHKDTKARNRFRYAVSAFAAAARSVTFVLQSQYRSAYGQTFESWYEMAKQRLKQNPAAHVLLDLRNVTQKEGNRLPLWCIEGVGPSGTCITVTYDVTSEGEDAVIGWGIQFAPDDRPSLNLAESEPSRGEILGALLNEGAPQMGRFLTDEAFQLYAPGREWLVISDDRKEVTFPEFLKMCEDFVALLRELVLEARAAFDAP